MNNIDSDTPMNPDDMNGVLRDNLRVNQVKLDLPNDGTFGSVRRTLGQCWTLSGTVELSPEYYSQHSSLLSAY